MGFVTFVATLLSKIKKELIRKKVTYVVMEC